MARGTKELPQGRCAEGRWGGLRVLVRLWINIACAWYGRTGMDNEKTITIEHPSLDILKAHEGEWVALDGDQIIASGNNVTEVRRHARERGHDKVILYLVPSTAGSLAPHTV